MGKGKNDLERKCSIFKKSVIDTSFLSYSEILHIIEKDKSTCLKINVNSNKSVNVHLILVNQDLRIADPTLAGVKLK